MLETWSEIELLAAAIFGEARGEPWAGKVGVGLTIRTRVDHPGHWNWGRNWREVITAPKQFSCFQDINLDKIKAAKKKNTDEWKECMMIAEHVYHNRIDNHIGCPTHYHTAGVSPSWDKSMKYLGSIGGHLFYSCLED